MKYLLDTHVLLWSLYVPTKLPEFVSELIASGENLHVSVVSLWEIAIKKSIRKLDLQESVSQIEDVCVKKGIEILPISVAALEHIQNLPDIHRDPFDRLLIATAVEDDMALITNDTKISNYDVHTVWDKS